MENSSDVHWVGIDVSKKTFDAALALSGQRFPSTPLRDVTWKSFPRTSTGTDAFVKWIDELIVKQPSKTVGLVMEATGRYSVELAELLVKRRPNYAPAIENPTRVKHFINSLGQRNKTDGMDARGLAFYGVERRPAAYEPLSQERQALRELTRHRDVLVNDRTALKNRMKEKCTSKFVARLLNQEYAQLAKYITKVEQEMKRLITKAPKLKHDFDLLVSIPGVGFVTAATMLAELGDLRRFKKARQLTAFAGVSPRNHQSGTSVRGKAHLCKRGNGRVRQVLFLSCMAVLRTKKDNHLKTVHKRLSLENGKSSMAALGAMMRKQLVLMRAILLAGKPYDPLWKTQREMAMARSN